MLFPQTKMLIFVTKHIVSGLWQKQGIIRKASKTTIPGTSTCLFLCVHQGHMETSTTQEQSSFVMYVEVRSSTYSP